MPGQTDGAAPETGAPRIGAGRRVLLAATAFAVCVALVLALVGWDGNRQGSASVGRTAATTAGNPEHLPTMPARQTAPAFDLPRLGGGAPVSSADFAGTPLVINFFASWCPNCIDEMKAFATEANSVRGRVAFVGVDLNDPDQQAARTVTSRAGVRYPVAVDRSAAIAISYWIVALPTTVFIDRHGRLLGEAFGAQSPSQLRSWVSRLERT